MLLNYKKNNYTFKLLHNIIIGRNLKGVCSMETLEPYVFIKKILGSKLSIQTWLSKICIPDSSVSFTKEGFIDVHKDKNILYGSYYSIQSQYELVYDQRNDEIVPEKFKKVVKAEITIMLDSNIIIIWSRPSLIKKIEKDIETASESSVTLQSVKLNYSKCFNNLINQDFIVRKISFNNLKLLGSNIKSITIEVPSNNEAYSIIRNIGTEISKIDIDILLSNDEKLTLKFNLKAGIIRTEFKILSKTNIEIAKELIDKLCLDGGEYNV